MVGLGGYGASLRAWRTALTDWAVWLPLAGRFPLRMPTPFAYWVHNLSPFLVRFSDNVGIRYYGLAYVLGALGSVWLLLRYARAGRSQLPAALVWDFIMAVVLGVMLGGRIGSYLLYDGWRTFSEDPLAIFRVWEGGMASHGGFVGVTMFAPFLAKGIDSTIDDYAEAIEYTLNLVGEDAIGIGTDFTQGHGQDFFEMLTHDKGYARRLTRFGEIINPLGIRTVGEFPNLTETLLKRGHSERLVRKIMGENWVNVLKDVWGE